MTSIEGRSSSATFEVSSRMASFGANYDAQSARSFAALQRRFRAISSPQLEESFMRDLGFAANRLQKKYLYTQAVTRRTGHSGQLITAEAATAARVLTVARGTAAWADTGTRPHIIKPRNKSILAWPLSGADRRLTGAARKVVKGGWAFAKIVHHPGTRPHPYMVRGAQDAVKEVGLTDRIVTAWNGAA